MKISSLIGLSLLFTFVTFSAATGQAFNPKPVKVAVFAPLYLDEAFDGDDYKLGKLNIPKNILPGLEFYNGVMMAVDSLNKEGVAIELSIHDTKSITEPLNSVLHSHELDSSRLFIAAITTPAELKLFSQEGLKRQIPIISATYPSTAGVSGNPNFVLINSAFNTHLEAIYSHLQKYYNTSSILMIKRKGTTADYLKTSFTAMNAKPRGVPLKMTWLELNDTFPSKQIVNKLDSFANNVVVVASPYESFGLNVVRNLSANKAYRTTAIGMPTWDGVKEFSNPDCRYVDIVYSTPFYYSQNKVAQHISSKYLSKFHSRPSDMVYRGFEAMYHFTKLLVKHQDTLSTNLADNDFTVFNTLDIQPVKGKENQVEYYENKKLYFIKKQEGNLKAVY